MHYTTVVSLEMSDEPNVWPNEQKLDMRLKYVDKVAKRFFRSQFLTIGACKWLASTLIFTGKSALYEYFSLFLQNIAPNN